jgi:predicted DNA-binding transcriptional regulator YafY
MDKMGRLTQQVVDEMARLHREEGVTHRELGRRFHVSGRTVARHLSKARKGSAAPTGAAVTPPSGPLDPPTVTESDRLAPVVADRLREGVAPGELLNQVPLSVLENLLPRLAKLDGMAQSSLTDRVQRLEGALRALVEAVDALADRACLVGDPEEATDRFLDGFGKARDLISK